MYKTKLIRTLRRLDSDEITAFQSFVASPFFNKREANIRLLAILIPHAPAFEAQAIEKQRVFSLLYPEKPFDLQKLKDESKHLFALLRQFLAHSAIQKDPIAQDLLALRELRRRTVKGVFQSQWRALERKLAAIPVKDEETYFQLYRLHEEGNDAYGLQEVRVADNSLSEALAAFDRYYLLKKIRGSAELLNRQKILGTDADIPLALHLISFLEQHPQHFQDTPGINLYQLLVKTFISEDKDQAFHELTAGLKADIEQLTREEASAFFKYGQNYCVARINTGEGHFLTVLFDLYRFQLENGLLEDLSHASYSNIIATGLRLGETEWVYDFMQSQKSKLIPKFREAVYHYNLALYHYNMKDFRPAQPLLQSIQFTDGFYALSAKLLLCRIYFEVGEYEALNYLIDAFQRHLSRTKDLTPSRREPYQQFLRFLKKATRLRDQAFYVEEPVLLQRQEKLRQAIAEAKAVLYRGWLLETACVEEEVD